jgi:hypothetical protein
VSGTFTVGRETIALKHVTVAAVPDSFLKGQTAYKVTLSDAPIADGDFARRDKVKAGQLHYLELTIGADKVVYSGMIFHKGLGAMSYVSLVGPHVFEGTTFGPTEVAGKLFVRKPVEVGMEDTPLSYSAEFRAPVRK